MGASHDSKEQSVSFQSPHWFFWQFLGLPWKLEWMRIGVCQQDKRLTDKVSYLPFVPTERWLHLKFCWTSKELIWMSELSLTLRCSDALLSNDAEIAAASVCWSNNSCRGKKREKLEKSKPFQKCQVAMKRLSSWKYYLSNWSAKIHWLPTAQDLTSELCAFQELTI